MIAENSELRWIGILGLVGARALTVFALFLVKSETSVGDPVSSSTGTQRLLTSICFVQAQILSKPLRNFSISATALRNSSLVFLRSEMFLICEIKKRGVLSSARTSETLRWIQTIAPFLWK